MGRTLSKVQQALSWSYGEEVKPFKPPLSDTEFHSYLNGQGQLTRPEELRLRIYHGGVEPSLRKVEICLCSITDTHPLQVYRCQYWVLALYQANILTLGISGAQIPGFQNQFGY